MSDSSNCQTSVETIACCFEGAPGDEALELDYEIAMVYKQVRAVASLSTPRWLFYQD